MPEFSSRHFAPPPSPKWQFRLSYLMYLLTVFAVGFALIRSVLNVSTMWLVAGLGTIYVSALMVYFGLRVPFLIRRWRRGRQAINQRRRELQKFADDTPRQS